MRFFKMRVRRYKTLIAKNIQGSEFFRLKSKSTYYPLYVPAELLLAIYGRITRYVEREEYLWTGFRHFQNQYTSTLESIAMFNHTTRCFRCLCPYALGTGIWVYYISISRPLSNGSYRYTYYLLFLLLRLLLISLHNAVYKCVCVCVWI